MHICLHAYVSTCIHAYMHTFIHAYMHTCIHAFMLTFIHAYMYKCIYTTKEGTEGPQKGPLVLCRNKKNGHIAHISYSRSIKVYKNFYNFIIKSST